MVTRQMAPDLHICALIMSEKTENEVLLKVKPLYYFAFCLTTLAQMFGIDQQQG